MFFANGKFSFSMADYWTASHWRVLLHLLYPFLCWWTLRFLLALNCSLFPLSLLVCEMGCWWRLSLCYQGIGRPSHTWKYPAHNGNLLSCSVQSLLLSRSSHLLSPLSIVALSEKRPGCLPTHLTGDKTEAQRSHMSKSIKWQQENPGTWGSSGLTSPLLSASASGSRAGVMRSFCFS